MNKYLTIAAFIGVILLSENCKVKEYEPQFEFIGKISAQDSAYYISEGNEGFKHYKQFCGSCHGITHNGKPAIPDFTNEQLEDYNLRWQMNQGSNHVELDELSDNQLNQILIFLQYHKIKK